MAVNTGFLFAGGASIIKANGADLGATTDGIRISKNTDWLDFEIDQRKAKVRKEAIMTTMMMETTLAENKLENLRLAWSQPASTLVNSSSLIVAESDGSQELELYLEGPTHTVPYSGSTKWSKRVYVFYRGVALADTEINLARPTPTNVPFRVELLMDTTKTTPRWGEIYEVA